MLLPQVLGGCGPARDAGTPMMPTPKAAPLVDAGDAAATTLPSALPSPPQQRFSDPASSFAWTFPDGSTRHDRAQRLATKLSAQLDAEHDRATTGMGFAFALVVDGEIVLLKAKGIADLENRRVATPDTIYRVASITKTFTASAVMALRDDGKLRESDPLAKHLPELDVVYPHHDAAPIRIEDVLTHSAGLARSGSYADVSRPSTEADLFDAMKLPLTTDPGLGHRYSNFGFGVLGLMVGRVAGVPYRDFVRTRLLEPLKMTSSGYDLARLPPDRLAIGYKRNGTPYPMNMNGAGEGAGGLYSTARDMAEWIRFELAAWPPRDDVDTGPLKRATLREMQTPRMAIAVVDDRAEGGASRTFSASVGLAWEVNKGCYFDRLVGHDGALDGFNSSLRFDVNRGLGFVLLGNSDAGDIAGVRERILDTIATDDDLAPRRRDPAPALVARTESIVKRIGTSWKLEDHVESFTEALRSQLGLGDAVALGARIAKEVGTCTSSRVDVVTDALDAELVFQCSRGLLRASVRGTTTSPLRLLGFKVDVMTPAKEDDLVLARGLVARMRSRDDDALATLLGSKANVTAQSKMLLKAGADAGPCKVDGGDVSPWSRAASFRLVCSRTRATLRVHQRESNVVEILGVDAPKRCLR